MMDFPAKKYFFIVFPGHQVIMHTLFLKKHITFLLKYISSTIEMVCYLLLVLKAIIIKGGLPEQRNSNFYSTFTNYITEHAKLNNQY